MAQPRRRSQARREPPAASRIDAFLRPYVSEPALWPVTLVLLAHGVLAVAVALLEGLRDGKGFGIASLVLMALGLGASLTCDARRHRIGLASGALLLSAILGAVCAWYADRYALY